MMNSLTIKSVKSVMEELKNSSRVTKREFINKNKTLVLETIHALVEDNALEELETFCLVLGISTIKRDDKVVYQCV